MILIYLNNCGVDRNGSPNPFMVQELDWLRAHFDKVALVSHSGIHTFTKDEVPPFQPWMPPFSHIRAALNLPFRREVYQEINKMHKAGTLNFINFLKLLAFTQRGLQMHYCIERLIKNNAETHTVLYSMWMSYDAYAGALSKQKHPHLRMLVRGHAYDIDPERNPMNPWLMKEEIANEANGLYLISETARQQYLSYMKGKVDESRVKVLAMGSAGDPVDSIHEPPRYSQGVTRIISCARVTPIKQVHLLAEALSRWEGFPLHWIHVGGGDGEKELRDFCADKLDSKDNVIYELLGDQTPERIDQLYQTKGFDAIINTSQKEGMPVSLMEAMRYGIPAIAPAVGGLPEMIQPGLGLLYDPQDGNDGILKALEKLTALSPEELTAMHENCRKYWNEHYCSRILLTELFKEVL